MCKNFMIKALLFGMVSLTLIACTKSGESAFEATKTVIENQSDEIVEVERDKSAKVITSIFEEGNVKVEYPEITNLKNKERQNELNEVIKQEALRPYLEIISAIEPEYSYEAEGIYEVKFMNGRILSVAYSSYNNIQPSAHPFLSFYTTNINLETGELLFLTDLVNDIDEEFINQLRNATYVGHLGEEYAEQIKETAFSTYGSNEALISALKNSKETNKIHVYLKKDALGISLPVAHAAGDHAEFEIPLTNLDGIILLR